MRGVQLRPSVGPAALATQPLTVQQVRAGELGPKAGTAQPADRLAIGALGVLAVVEQRPAARVGPLPPVGLANAGGLSQPGERAGLLRQGPGKVAWRFARPVSIPPGIGPDRPWPGRLPAGYDTGGDPLPRRRQR